MFEAAGPVPADFKIAVAIYALWARLKKKA